MRMHFLLWDCVFSMPLATLQSYSMKGRSDIKGILKQEPVLVNMKEKEPMPAVKELDGAAHPKWFKTLSHVCAKF